MSSQSAVTRRNITRRWAAGKYAHYLQEGVKEWDNPDEEDVRVIIITPFTRPDADIIEVEVVLEPGGEWVSINDMGKNAAFLEGRGIYFDKSLKVVLQRIARSYGVHLSSAYNLERRAHRNDVGEAIHDICQASIAISNLHR